MDKRRKTRGHIEDLNIPDTAERRPFDRLPGEGPKPYAAFKYYCDLGPERALKRVAADMERATDKGIRDWSARWLWRERVKHWDAHMEEIKQKAKEKAAAEVTEKWAMRRMEFAEANWERAKQLAKKADKMLQAPLYEETITVTDKDGNPVAVTMVPAKWDFKTVGALSKLVAELQQASLAAALGGQEDDGFDPTTATPEECRAYLEEQGLLPKALPAPVKAGD